MAVVMRDIRMGSTFEFSDNAVDDIRIKLQEALERPAPFIAYDRQTHQFSMECPRDDDLVPKALFAGIRSCIEQQQKFGVLEVPLVTPKDGTVVENEYHLMAKKTRHCKVDNALLDIEEDGDDIGEMHSATPQRRYWQAVPGDNRIPRPVVVAIAQLTGSHITEEADHNRWRLDGAGSERAHEKLECLKGAVRLINSPRHTNLLITGHLVGEFRLETEPVYESRTASQRILFGCNGRLQSDVLSMSITTLRLRDLIEDGYKVPKNLTSQDFISDQVQSSSLWKETEFEKLGTPYKNLDNSSVSRRNATSYRDSSHTIGSKPAPQNTLSTNHLQDKRINRRVLDWTKGVGEVADPNKVKNELPVDTTERLARKKRSAEFGSRLEDTAVSATESATRSFDDLLSAGPTIQEISPVKEAVPSFEALMNKSPDVEYAISGGTLDTPSSSTPQMPPTKDSKSKPPSVVLWTFDPTAYGSKGCASPQQTSRGRGSQQNSRGRGTALSGFDRALHSPPNRVGNHHPNTSTARGRVTSSAQPRSYAQAASHHHGDSGRAGSSRGQRGRRGQSAMGINHHPSATLIDVPPGTTTTTPRNYWNGSDRKRQDLLPDSSVVAAQSVGLVSQTASASMSTSASNTTVKTLNLMDKTNSDLGTSISQRQPQNGGFYINTGNPKLNVSELKKARLERLTGETLQDTDEVSTRKTHDTMNQRANKRTNKKEAEEKRRKILDETWGRASSHSSKSEVPTTVQNNHAKSSIQKPLRGLDLPRDERIAEVEVEKKAYNLCTILQPVFAALRPYQACITFEVRFGQIFTSLPREKYDQVKYRTLEQWNKIYLPGQDGLLPTSHFNKTLTSNGADVDFIVDLKVPGQVKALKMFNHEPTERKVVYEFYCQTKTSESFILAINSDGRYHITEPPAEVSITNIHFASHVWDAAAVVSVTSVWTASKQVMEAAKQLVDSLFIEGGSRLDIVYRVPASNELEVKAVISKRTSVHQSLLADRSDVLLKIAEVRNLTLEDHTRGNSVQRATSGGSDKALVEDGRLFYEVSTFSRSINDTLATNESIELGENHDKWHEKSLITHDKIRGILDVTNTVVTNIDSVGIWNKEPSGDFIVKDDETETVAPDDSATQVGERMAMMSAQYGRLRGLAGSDQFW